MTPAPPVEERSSIDAPPGPSRSTFRPEIQALRAVAVMAVVLNHLWPGRFSGGFVGVDIFFVISGYLITAHLLREVAASGTIALPSFWARRARRLLPASATVLFFSLVATLLVVPATQWQLIVRQIGASALYVQNWALVQDAVDYFASLDSASPVTHFWSLSVEEQFYLVWPLLILLAVAIAGRRSKPARRAAIVVIALVTVASLVYSVVRTETSPNTAYFETFTRAWEFGLGGLVAGLGLRAPRRASAAAVVGWAGWAGLAATFVLIDESTPFPGGAALLPVVATVLILVGGSPEHSWSPTQLVSFGPVQKLGDISYSLYLWHWPLIIFLPYVLDRRPGDLWLSALLVASIVLAVVSKRWIEDPGRRAAFFARARPRRTYIATGGLMAALVAVCLVPAVWVGATAGAEQARIDAAIAANDDCLGARALVDGSCSTGRVIDSTAPALAAAEDLANEVDSGETCTQNRDDSEIVRCAFGASEQDATLTIALTGDSHAGHWIGAFDRMAADEGWRVELFIKSSCPTTVSTAVQAAWYPDGAESCHVWAADVVRTIAEDPAIDVVATSSIAREYVQRGAVEQFEPLGPEAFETTWRTWTEAGKRVMVLGDTPRFDIGDIPTCVAASSFDDPCTVEAAPAVGADPMVEAATALDDERIGLIDANDLLCEARCHVLQGGMVAFGDGNHMTTSFSRTLGDALRPDVLRWLARSSG